MATVAERLLGPPNRRLSKPGRELRYGRRGSLAVDLRRGLWHDHERGEGGGVLDLVIHKGQAKDRAAAAAWLTAQSLVRDGEWLRLAPDRHDDTDMARHQACARRIWREAIDPRGTPAERYLKSRGLALPDTVAGRVLRFHPDCPFGKGQPRRPCLVAAFRPIRGDLDPDAEPVAIHRIALVPSTQRKMMLGPVTDAAIKLSSDQDVGEGLGICEGIETGLAILNAGWAPVWALGSADAIEHFPVLSGITALSIFADHDASGTGSRAAEICADRWLDHADVLITTPHAIGADWADIGE
jgi:hypothetical protein